MTKFHPQHGWKILNVLYIEETHTSSFLCSVRKPLLFQELNICRSVTRYQHHRNWLALKPGANPLATANPLAPFRWHRSSKCLLPLGRVAVAPASTVRRHDRVYRMCPSIGRPETPAANVEIRICCPATSNLAGCPKRGSQELPGSAIWRTDVTVWSSSADAPSMSSQKKLFVERRCVSSPIST
jgi:hypothetical protein